ncbi:ubiA prenyltransferase domain-containing protein 1-like isoform X1 [Biomphalaria glabrata]|nr:ubiA prenyltransferase domain-containing protein 1-like isoform X1 [Biomphalaria glabrata]KAI8795810.1 ubiA prenyltransferase domain-containing protein 1 isoform X1 [Biomphalaria glabrata]
MNITNLTTLDQKTDVTGTLCCNDSTQPRVPHVKIQLPLIETATQTEEWIPTGFQSNVSSSEKPPPFERKITNNIDSYSMFEDTMLTSNNHKDFRNFRFIPIKKGKLSKYLIALRPWSFTASITPVALGSCLAYKTQGVFNISIFFAAIVTALCVHAAGNLVNTYFDFVKGIDNKKSDDRTLVDNILLPNDVVTLGAMFYVAGCVGFMLLNIMSPAKMEHLALIYFCGLSSSFFYTGGLGLKYIALGDLLIVLTFGPLTVVFSYLSQTGQLSLTPLIYAIPLALNTEAILHSNNTRDMESDRLAGALTVAIILGKTGSYCLFCFLLFVPYIVYIIVGLNYSPWMLLPAISIFSVFALEKDFRRGNLDTVPHQVARLNLIMGSLYIAAIYLAHPDTLPSLTHLN